MLSPRNIPLLLRKKAQCSAECQGNRKRVESQATWSLNRYKVKRWEAPNVVETQETSGCLEEGREGRKRGKRERNTRAREKKLEISQVCPGRVAAQRKHTSVSPRHPPEGRDPDCHHGCRGLLFCL